eukprot:TRINITY_DN9067_c0_g1_i1.p1 TRINITY_DN9067_c0_g1~~TRINITY_DN9067_c0_g1_i1.p1  ORF type:complete len:120 (+),score=21.42 TRINITY_DN9067_c0_g1_i1:51-362(+)
MSTTIPANIGFDIHAIDVSGLRGPATGKVAVSYEFAIPRTNEHMAEVSAIDTTVQFSQSRGRIRATNEEYLCIGSTHQPEWLSVLTRLSQLAYVKKIEECFFE